MKFEEYALEVTALLSRIKNTATMVNAYVSKIHAAGLLVATDSLIATTAIKMVDQSMIPSQVRAMFLVDVNSIDTRAFGTTIGGLECRLKVLNRICMQFQELHAFFVKEGKLK